MAAVLVSTALVLAAAELCARFVFKMEPASLKVNSVPWLTITGDGIRLTPDTKLDLLARINSREVLLEINSMGFRGPEMEVDRPAGTRTILFLGDSVVFGPGLEYQETIPARLESMLGQGTRVINGGVPGMSMEDELAWLEEVMGEVWPDIVILGFYLNDTVRSIVLVEEYGDLGEFWVESITRARRCSAMANLVWKRVNSARLINARKMKTGWVNYFNQGLWKERREAYDRIVELADDDFGAAWKESSWERTDRRMERFAKRCRAAGARPAAVIFPVSIQVESKVADSYPQERFMQISEKHGVPVLDLLPALRENNEVNIFYDQCHFTPQGAHLAARLIADWLATLK